MYQNIYQKHIPTIYENIFKYIQDLPNIYKVFRISTRYQAAVGPAHAQGRARAGLGPARAGGWAGPAAALYFVCVLYIWIYLDVCLTFFLYIFEYIFWGKLEASLCTGVYFESITFQSKASYRLI